MKNIFLCTCLCQGLGRSMVYGMVVVQLTKQLQRLNSRFPKPQLGYLSKGCVALVRACYLVGSFSLSFALLCLGGHRVVKYRRAHPSVTPAWSRGAFWCNWNTNLLHSLYQTWLYCSIQCYPDFVVYNLG